MFIENPLGVYLPPSQVINYPPRGPRSIACNKIKRWAELDKRLAHISGVFVASCRLVAYLHTAGRCHLSSRNASGAGGPSRLRQAEVHGEDTANNQPRETLLISLHRDASTLIWFPRYLAYTITAGGTRVFDRYAICSLARVGRWESCEAPSLEALHLPGNLRWLDLC